MLQVLGILEHVNHHIDGFFTGYTRIAVQHLGDVRKTFSAVQCGFQIAGLAAQLNYCIDDFIFRCRNF